MNKNVCVAAFLVGLLAIVWVGVGYLTHPVALTMTTLIAAVYLTGAREMFRFRGRPAVRPIQIPPFRPQSDPGGGVR